MQIGLTSVTFRKLGAAQIIRFAAGCGMNCIEWGADIHARPDDTAALRDISKACDEYGVEPVSYGSYYKAGCDNEFTAEQVVAAAARLGVRRIRVWAGDKGAALFSEAEFTAMVNDLKRFEKIAAANGMTVATEFHHHSYTEYAQDALRLLNAVPGLRTYWQENPQLSANDNCAQLKLLSPYVDAVHVFCFDSDFRRYPLKNAEDRWHEYIKILKEAGKNDMPFLLEFVKDDSLEQAEKDARQLKIWLEE